jgi:predicted nucleotidyltransferase
MDERYKLFLENLIFSILSKYGESIYSMVVYGSFATETAGSGSDLDLLFHLKNGVEKEKIADLNKILFELESKYEIEVAWTLRVPFLRQIHPPIMIFEYNDLNWRKIYFNNPHLRWTIALSNASKNIFFQNIKKTGQVVYGENVLDHIQVSIRLKDKIFSSLMYPIYRLGKSTSKLVYTTFFRNNIYSPKT